MKPIALIEDRTERQKFAIEKNEINLSPYSDILENITGNLYEEFVEQLVKSEEILDRYAALIVHQSAFGDQNTAMLHRIIRQCEVSQIPLVLFSGGIPVGRYDAEPFNKIEINSMDLYSYKLPLFLDHYRKKQEVELLILQYGQKWQIEILLNIQEKVDLFLLKVTDEDIVFNKFVNETDFLLLDSLNIDCSQPQVENGWIYREELQRIANELHQAIQQKVYHA